MDGQIVSARPLSHHTPPRKTPPTPKIHHQQNYERFVSFTHILFSAARVEEVGRFVRSLLV